MLYTPSLIQTILSVSELHRFLPVGSRTITAGGDFHPAPKTSIPLCSLVSYYICGKNAIVSFAEIENGKLLQNCGQLYIMQKKKEVQT